jgi:8-oxo-dGTP pyrophosphatase MutT (NUDIX family)
VSATPTDYKRKYRVPAVFVLLLKDQKLFTIRREHTGWMDGKITIPSGHVEEGETYIEAAIRETQEEAGVLLGAANLQFAHFAERDVATGDRIWDDVYFICNSFEGEPYNAEPEKHGESGWVDYNNLPQELMVPPVHDALMQLKQGILYSVYPRK